MRYAALVLCGASKGAPFAPYRNHQMSTRRLATTRASAAHNGDDAAAAGRTKRHLDRAARRDDRISLLEAEAKVRSLDSAEEAELRGLGAFREQYDPESFSDHHRAFKASHNAAFSALARYCDPGIVAGGQGINLLYLDGQDAGTTRYLHQRGFDLAKCFVANRHEESCEAIRSVGAPLGMPRANVAHVSAADTLGSSDSLIGSTRFGAYYFDGCGGYVPLISEMIAAALGSAATLEGSDGALAPVALGFSIVGGNRDVVDKEQAVVRGLVTCAREAGFCEVRHVLDEPLRFGVDPLTRKVEGSTLTSWFVLE